MNDEFWFSCTDSGPTLTDDAIAEWEQRSGFVLPASLVDRWRRLNGGIPRFSAFPLRRNADADDKHIARPFRISSLLPIQDEYGGAFPIEDLGPEQSLGVKDLVCIGHEEDDFFLLCLDYRSGGRSHEPAVSRFYSNNDGSSDLRGDDAVESLASSFEDFVSQCIRGDLADAFGIAVPDADLPTVWARVCEGLDLVEEEDPPDAWGEVCGHHPSWTSVPGNAQGVAAAWFDIEPNDNEGEVLFPDDREYNWVVRTDIHPRFRSRVAEGLQQQFAGRAKPLHYVDWRAWRSELSESLDEYCERPSA